MSDHTVANLSGMAQEYILSVDQGTTRTKAIVFDRKANLVASAYREVPQIYPKPGWVEQDPDIIWRTVVESIDELFKKAEISPREVAGIGIADQGETVVIWDRETGRPVYNAIVWQCRRTAKMCEEIKKEGLEAKIAEKTGLLLDPYFSATKIKWILENVDGVREKAERGEVLFGTTDTWLVWNFTHGRSFITDFATASRTMIFNIRDLRWDREILGWLDIPEEILPKPVSNSQIVGHADLPILCGEETPISGVVVDQQGALFGQTCYHRGDVKCTYGTGCFTLMNTGKQPITSKHRLLTTIAWALDDEVTYALDGGVFIAGAAVQWLRDGLKIIDDPAQTEEMASRVMDTGGVYFVPAFVGLAAPHWNTHARGSIFGVTGGTKREHVARATLESIAYQVNDVLECMQIDSVSPIKRLRVDGGPTANKFLMQFQADVLGIPIEVPHTSETTALGAAYLAGLAVDFWENTAELERTTRVGRIYRPRMRQVERERLLAGWRKAVECVLSWKGKR